MRPVRTTLFEAIEPIFRLPVLPLNVIRDASWSPSSHDASGYLHSCAASSRKPSLTTTVSLTHISSQERGPLSSMSDREIPT